MNIKDLNQYLDNIDDKEVILGENNNVIVYLYDKKIKLSYNSIIKEGIVIKLESDLTMLYTDKMYILVIIINNLII